MSNKLTYLFAGLLIITMFAGAFFSMTEDSLTYDELAHIPAGYSYLTQQDYRVNPEHPPLLKGIAALPLLFLNLNFPLEDQTWIQDSAPAWWVQFDLGTKFLYGSGNSPTEIIFWSRIPMILLTLLLGLFVFKWARKLAGNEAALAVLAIFCFSPTILANGRLVTTDVGAAFGAVLATYFWLKFLPSPKAKNIILAALGFGIALLCKFSLVLLVPFFAIITIVYALLFSNNQKMKNLLSYALKAILIGVLAMVFVVGPIYQLVLQNYPPEQQKRDTVSDLGQGGMQILKNADIWMADKPLLRPFSQFFRGILMAGQRTIFGNTVYFLGEVSTSAWWYYFPTIFLLKESLPFLLICLTALIGSILLMRRGFSLKQWVKNNFTLFSFIVFIAIYWLAAVLGNLNIGIRHLLPTFPFIFILAVLGLKTIIDRSRGKIRKILLSLSAILFLWHIGSSVSAFPHYISYYNELVGSDTGYKYAVDSNYDWGQDFYRLLVFVEKNNIEKINLDYFGGENPEYWLKDKYVRLKPKEITEPPKGWVAVSVNELQRGIADPVPGFNQETGYYNWLKDKEPVAKMGYSIFVYYID
ncbi:MAG: glycosyltransferase family 39 protein [Candidatus Paceibacterota bacterium]|jgi:hypothetical protein